MVGLNVISNLVVGIKLKQKIKTSIILIIFCWKTNWLIISNIFKTLLVYTYIMFLILMTVSICWLQLLVKLIFVVKLVKLFIKVNF